MFSFFIEREREREREREKNKKKNIALSKLVEHYSILPKKRKKKRIILGSHMLDNKKCFEEQVANS